mmetsp:Transcript_8900/g.16305  ORF Transcript_8900/g.16305 Transcript_8900/m.16305 type:complete len:122 (-) Transcript_8900:379-744(-)
MIVHSIESSRFQCIFLCPARLLCHDSVSDFLFCTPEKSLHSRRNIALLFCLMIVEPMGTCSSLPIPAPFTNAAVTLASPPPEQHLLLDFICFHVFVPLHEIQILPGTVIGLKNNLPNFASA